MMTKDKSSNDEQLPLAATISRPSPYSSRLRGSHSSNHGFVARRPPGDDEGPPDPIDPEDPGDPEEDPPTDPPPPPISTPDLAMQIATCIDESLRDRIINTFRALTQADADVRTACIRGTQRIGVWLRPAVARDNEARNAALGHLELLAAEDTFCYFINTSLIRRQVFDAWNDNEKFPKRLNGSGEADSGGPIHLTGLSLNFDSPNKIVTRVKGFDERPWPDVDFQLTITDTLTASDGVLHCDTTRDLDTDTSWLNFLTILFALPGTPNLFGWLFLAQRLIVGSQDAPPSDADTPGDAALALIPKEFQIAGGQKLVASYRQIDVSSGGIFAGGSVALAARTPRVTLSGPQQLSVFEGWPAITRTFALSTSDLRPPFDLAAVAKLNARVMGTDGTSGVSVHPSISWSGDGEALQPKSETTKFRFNLQGLNAGDVVTRRVSARVEDSDGLNASADLMVEIRVESPPEPEETQAALEQLA
jgi:hypothetical protein